MWSNMWSGGFFDHIGLRGKCLYRRRIKGLRSRYFPARRGSSPLPNQARYQLRYTRIFNFCHDTTASGKNKVFSVCGHSCGQNRFCAVFCNRGKSRKRRCRKALRRFASSYPGYNHGTPKAGALPTALHPDMKLWGGPGVFSQSWRATNCAIPGYSIFLHDTMRRRKKQVFRVCGQCCGQARFCGGIFRRGISAAGYCPKDFQAFTFWGMDRLSILPNHACCQLRYIWS